MKGCFRRIKAVRPDLLTMCGDGFIQEIERYIESVKGGLAMVKCKGCGEEIIFIKSPAGKFIPCNPSKVIYSNPGEGKARVVTQSGEVISCTVGADDDTSKAVGVGYIPHWSTCKAANQFRKRRKKESPLESSLF